MEISEPRCHVCQSRFRRTIDQLLAVGVPFSEIARQFGDENLSRKSISNHRDKHLNVTDAAVRHVLEERAKQMGEDIENGKKTLLTRRGILEVAIMQGYQSIISGQTPVEPRELASFLTLAEKWDESSSSVEKEELQLQMQAFLDAVHNIVPKVYWIPVAEEFERLLAQRGKIIDAYAVQMPDIDLPDELKKELDSGE
jgi:hypothetical protein